MPVKALKRLGKITIEHTKAGIPNPCIRVRKGSGKVFLQNYFDPSTAFDVEVTSLLMGGHLIPKRESPVQKLKRAPKVKVCLWDATKKKRKR